MIDNYKKLKTIYISNRIPKAYFPNPKNRDYEIGFISRYFTQMRGTPGAPIFEISEDTFSDYSNTPFYIGVKINWKITGDLEDKYTEKGEYIPSVHTVNTLSIREGEKILPELNLYLVNTKQFHRLV
jgi:hypothetical protein